MKVAVLKILFRHKSIGFSAAAKAKVRLAWREASLPLASQDSEADVRRKVKLRKETKMPRQSSAFTKFIIANNTKKKNIQFSKLTQIFFFNEKLESLTTCINKHICLLMF